MNLLLFLTVLAALLFLVLYGAWWLDQWEADRERDWRVEESLRRAREALDRPYDWDEAA